MKKKLNKKDVSGKTINEDILANCEISQLHKHLNSFIKQKKENYELER